MARYIDADEVLDNIKDLDETEFADGTIYREEAIWFINNAPTADVQEVKHGHWTLYDNNFNAYECSACGEIWCLDADTPKENNMNYCMKCGAKMSL